MSNIEFKDTLRSRFLELLKSERGVQAKLAKSIDKPNSYFSAIKRGNPVNALHLRAVGLVYGPEKVNQLLGIVYLPQGNVEDSSINSTLQNFIQKFKDSKRVEKIIKQLLKIERISEKAFQRLEGHIDGIESMADILEDKNDKRESSETNWDYVNRRKKPEPCGEEERRRRKNGTEDQ